MQHIYFENLPLEWKVVHQPLGETRRAEPSSGCIPISISILRTRLPCSMGLYLGDLWQLVALLVQAEASPLQDRSNLRFC